MTGVKAQAEALLNGATAPDTWYFQPGWGLQFAPEPGTLGLLVPDDAPAKTGDLLLMEAAPTLAQQVVELAEEVERLKAERDAYRIALDDALPVLELVFERHQILDRMGVSMGRNPCQDELDRVETEMRRRYRPLKLIPILTVARAALTPKEPRHD